MGLEAKAVKLGNCNKYQSKKMSEEILYDTVMTACANDPKARYQSATAMKRDLMICMDKICACEKGRITGKLRRRNKKKNLWTLIALVLPFLLSC